MMRHNRTCADHCTVPNSDAFQDDRTGTDPDIASDSDRAADKWLFGYGASPFKSMVVVRDVAEGADKAVTSDLDTFRCVEYGETVDVSATMKDQSWGTASRAGRQQDHAIIQCNPIGDHNVPWVSWYMNPPDPTFSTDANAEQSQTDSAQANGNCTRVTNEAIDQIVTEGSRAHIDSPVFAWPSSCIAERLR